MNRKLPLLVFGIVIFAATLYFQNSKEDTKLQVTDKISEISTPKYSKEEKSLFSQERVKYDFDMQKNPITGEIPREEKEKELKKALSFKSEISQLRATGSAYVSRGPSNLGGRTRAVVVDVSDVSGNTIIAGGVSGGVFKTTDGGANWTKVSPNDEIHNVTAIAQDPRPGSQNIWYYGTGEIFGNSARLGAFYYGQGVWQSTDSGDTWTQIPGTDSTFEQFNTPFDLINNLVVSPTTGDLYIAAIQGVYRYNGVTISTARQESANPIKWSDVAITGTGRVYVAIEGSDPENGIWTSFNGITAWSRIAENGTPLDWDTDARIVLATAPSNDNILYALYDNGEAHPNIEADLWQYNLATDTWTDYSSKLPDELGDNSPGNDPFAIQGGYDLVVSVKPDNENFVVIGGTNVYKIEDITTDPTFIRIGGYANNAGYSLYSVGGVDHHPDIHALEFDPNNNAVLYTGTDGGVHKTIDITAGTIPWVNLNNNYQTYQYYHIALDPFTGSNIVAGGAQDNGTTLGGTDAPLGLSNNTDMLYYAGGDGVAVGLTRRNANTALQVYLGFQRGRALTDYPSVRDINPVPTPDPDADPPENNLFVTYFYLDPDNTDTMYFGGNTTQAGYGTLYRTNNAENVDTSISPTNWTNLGDLPGGGNEWIRSMATTRGAYNAGTSYLLIGSDDGGVYRLDDPQNAIDLTGLEDITPPTASSGSIVSGVAVHPTNNDIAMVVYSNYGINSIFITDDATSNPPTWDLVENNLPSHSIRSAAIAEVGAETIYYVGTARGLYSSNDPITTDWDIEGQNEIGLAVVSGLVYRPSDRKLLIGTHGNGMFETTVEATLSIDDENLQNVSDIRLFPNPVETILNFKGSVFQSNEKVSFTLYDMTGKLVNKGVIQNRRIDVSQLNSGLYFINVDQATTNMKFIKE